MYSICQVYFLTESKTATWFFFSLQVQSTVNDRKNEQYILHIFNPPFLDALDKNAILIIYQRLIH